MINARICLLITGAAFGLWEGVDIFLIEVPAVAALFAAMFLACTVWFWRRDSSRAAGALLGLFAFEAAVAPSLNAMTVTKVAVIALAASGISSALGVLLSARRARRSPVITA